jgi:hypothetical protein
MLLETSMHWDFFLDSLVEAIKVIQGFLVLSNITLSYSSVSI